MLRLTFSYNSLGVDAIRILLGLCAEHKYCCIPKWYHFCVSIKSDSIPLEQWGRRCKALLVVQSATSVVFAPVEEENVDGIANLTDVP